MMADSCNELIGRGSHVGNQSTFGRELLMLLQETTGNLAFDDSGNARNGNIIGMGVDPNTVAGPNDWLPSAFDFDVTTAVDPDIVWNRTSDITVLCWVDIGSVENSGLFGYGNAPGGDNTDRLQAHVRWSDDNIYFDSGGSNTGERVSVVDNSTGWQFMAFRIRRNGGQLQSIRRNKTTLASATTVRTPPYSRKFLVGGVRQTTGALLKYGHYGPAAGFALYSEHLSDDECDQYHDGPEPLNTVAPTLSFGASTWSGTIGTWDSQSNGEITYTWQLRRASDNGVEQAGTGSSPAGSNPAAGEYYLWVRASNLGGHDPAEDSVSATESVAIDVVVLPPPLFQMPMVGV